MKINRLMEIVVLLLNKEVLTARDLAVRFEVSVRTIYRDIEVLSAAGVPVYMSKGHGGGISLLPGFSLNKTLLSDEDKESLLLTLQTLQVTGHPGVKQTLDRLGSLFVGMKNEDWVQVDLSNWGSRSGSAEKFSVIKEAILKRLVLNFSYINSAGVRSTRRVEPLRLVYKGHAWYLYGYCRVKNAYRLFRISRMRDLAVTKEQFERRALSDILDVERLDSPARQTTLKLRFRPEALSRVYDDFNEEQITRNPDNTCDVTVSYREDEWVYGYLLSFGPYVQVLEPQHIKELVLERAKQTARLYETN